MLANNIKCLILLMIATITLQSNIIVIPNSYTVNAVTYYTWQITFSNSTNRGAVNLTFPSACILSSSTTAFIGATQLSAANSSNILIITNASSLSNFVTITVNNVQNPFSAISTSAFSATTGIDSTITLSTLFLVPYQSGTLTTSTWSFSLCTEQPGSNLTVTVVTQNSIPSGNNTFYIVYGSWVNHFIKNLLYGVAANSLTALASLDGGITYSSVSIVFDTTTQKITISYSQSSTLASGSTLIFIVMGVNSPPTQTTPTTSSYYVSTADPTGNSIDKSSSITVMPTCVLTLNNGVFSDTSMPVNSNYPSPQITFSSTPIITIEGNDNIDMIFSPLSNFVACNTLNILRNINDAMQASLSLSSTYYQYTLPSSMSPNTEYNYTLTLVVTCSSVVITSSETPVPLTFTFYRSGSEYLQLTTSMTPSATLIPTNNAYSLLTSYQMTITNVTYTFSIVTSQPLGASPALKIYTPSGVTIPSSPTCTITLNPGTVTSQSCLYDSTSSIISVNLTASSSLASSTNITLMVTGITNPSTVVTSSSTPFEFGIQTYYYSTISTSRVEYNTQAFPITYSGITNYPTTFLPSSMTVYTNTPTTITLTNSIALPSGSIIYVQFPSQATILSVSGNPLTINGTTSNAGPTLNPNNTFTITTSTAISANSTLVISSTIKSPSSLGSYNYVIINISYNSTLYIGSSSSMFLYVNEVISLGATITPTMPIAGASSGYQIVLTISVPHPSSFYVEIDLPSDVGYTISGASCSGNCSSSLTNINSTSFLITASNSQPNNTGQTLSFTLAATFTNPRAVGNGMLWNITTSTISPSNTISFSQACPSISTANTLTATLLTDNYYINNTNDVKMNLTFTNSLISGDYILMEVSTLTYTQYTTIQCSSIFGTCTKSNMSTPGLLIINIVPNLTSVINKTLSLLLQGVISGSNLVDNIAVSSYNSTGSMTNTGTMPYSVSCHDNTTNNCQTCYSNHSCITCYTSEGFYLNSSTCVTSCGVATSYLTYNNNSTYTCQICINNCLTCTSSTACITCLSSYYLYTNYSCLVNCPVNGYISSTVNGSLYCNACYGTSCITCTSNAIGYCTTCTSSSVLSNGICSATCSNASTYPSIGVCYPCDVSCSTCTSAGNGGCTHCSLNYYNYSNYCVSSCPTGTAANSSGTCSCTSPCSKCQNSSTYCTACVNSSMFVSNGNCLSSCPSESYLNGSTCVSCSTGCTNCSATTCFSCLTSYFLYNNSCYSDCKLLGQQYDDDNTTCFLCPDGCSTCSGAVCSSCLASYSLPPDYTQCVQTCLLTASCSISASQVLPMPGLIAAILWSAIVVVIKLVLHKNYVPYSFIIVNAVIEFILVIAAIDSSPNPTTISITRMLIASSTQRTTIRALLGVALAMNYLSNIAYLVIFIKYIKPLIINPRQIDVISNIAVLALATLTNYRFALIAFSKMFPKPKIHIQNSSKLTPIHYLSLTSLLLDILPIIACGMSIYNQQPLSNLYMLSIDLLLIIAFNIITTIWFISCNKPEQYFEDEIKKYHIEDQHNTTNNTLPNEKSISKMHMVSNQSFHYTQDDATSKKQEPLHEAYQKLKAEPSKINIVSSNKLIRSSNDELPDDSHVLPVRSSKINTYNPYNDPNYEVGLKPKLSVRNVAPTRDKAQLSSDGRSVENALDGKQKASYNNSMQVVGSVNKREVKPEKGLQDEQDENYIPEMAQQSNNQSQESIFDKKHEKLARPKRIGTEKKMQKQNKILANSIDQPLKIMKKDKKTGYFLSDAFESNAEEDLESIIKQKVWQSTMKKEQPKQGQKPVQSNNSQTGYEQISPSWFNIQNQRIDISEFGDRESQP